MKVNTKVKKDPVYTHEGTPASHINVEQQLRRTVCSCLLWENTFYEDGISVAERIKSLVPKVKPLKVAQIAIEARNQWKLRHVPLLLVREMAKYKTHKIFVANTLSEIIQRPDELTEFLAIYWINGKQSLSAQVKKGLAKAFNKFDAYSLAKYNRNETVKLRDVLFLCHAKPIDAIQDTTWKKLINGTLESPDTWEVALSTGKNKKDTWERLIKEKKLGALALLRNLRNMESVNVNTSLIKQALLDMKTDRVLPFRFITAAAHAMHFESELEQSMMKCLKNRTKLPGKTILVIDVSGSMYSGYISEYSELNRAKAACSLGILVRELCEDAHIYATAGNDGTRVHATQEVPARRGFALSDAIYKMTGPLHGGGIFLTPVTKWLKEKEKDADRIIVITDEQDCAGPGTNAPSNANPFGKYNYLINVGTYKNGIGYDKWIHINGFSESILDFIQAYETIQ